MAGFDVNLGGAAGKRYPTTDVKVVIVPCVAPICTSQVAVFRFMPAAWIEPGPVV
jgi:hypothetical protein